MKRRIFDYSGDVDIEHGGIFYCISTFNDGYVEAVRVDPCTSAGGPDNMWWIEHLTVSVDVAHVPFAGVGDTAEARKAHRILHDWEDSDDEPPLIFCGFDADMEAWDAMGRVGWMHAIVQANASYGRFDKDTGACVRIGGPSPFFSEHKAREWANPDVVLRGNASLLRYVRKQLK